MPSLGFKGARGMRTATPFAHICLIGGAISFWYYMVNLDREPIVRQLQPPCRAPPSNAATLENMMEMEYRKVLHPATPIVK